MRDGSSPDILIGGPPCQGFSRVGRGKLDSLSDEGFAADARNSLYRRFVDAAEQWQPRAVVMENVPGMLSVEGRSVADEAASDLISRGYRVGYAALNACWLGVPQYRERLFFVGFRNDLGLQPSLPAATHHADLPAGYQPASPGAVPSVRGCSPRALASTPPAPCSRQPRCGTRSTICPSSRSTSRARSRPGATSGRAAAYEARPPPPLPALMRKWPGFPRHRTIDDHVIRRTPRDYETFRQMKHGDRYIEARRIARELFAAELARLEARGRATTPGTPEYEELEERFVPPYPEHMFKDKWRKLIPDQPSWTVPAHLAKDAYSHIHYDSDQARAISVREAARLQSFPDAFRFVGNMGDCFRQIGNAVPPLAAWAIAAHVLKMLGEAPRLPSWSLPAERI